MFKAKSVLGAVLISIMSLSVPGALLARAPETVDDLYKVDSKKFDEVFLLPGVDFRPYTKVMIDDPEVAFERNWQRDYNRSSGSLSNRISDRDAERILGAAREGLAEVFAGAFGKAGYEVVAAPGPDVLRIKVDVINLRINAPDVNSSARSRTYAREAGQAKIIIEARDSMSGALLGRAVDARRIGGSGFLTVRSRVSNRSDFGQAFKRWAQLSVEGLEALKDTPPVSSGN